MAVLLQQAVLTALGTAPAALDAVRIASRVCHGNAEVVAFLDNRAYVVASMGPGYLEPRRTTTAEDAVRAGDAMAAIGPSAAPIIDAAGMVVGALSVSEPLDDTTADVVATLARGLSRLLAEPVDDPDHRRFANAVLDGIRDIVLVVDRDFRIRWSNPSIRTQLGWDPVELIGRNATELLHPDDVAGCAEAAARLERGHEVYRLDLRLRHLAGHHERMVLTARDLAADPVVGGIVVTLRNDERKAEVERELDRNRRVSAAVLRDLHEPVIAADANGAVRLINTAARRLFGVEADAIAAEIEIGDLALADRDGIPVPVAEHPLAPGRIVSEETTELQVDTADGVRVVVAHAQRVCSEDDDLGVVLVLDDVTDALAADAELTRLALHDQLTGLANRRQLQERLAGCERRRGGDHIAVCFIDLDGFKAVNDLHGHRTGDALLQVAGERLREQLRGDDLLARHGGDEFVALLFDVASETETVAVADRIRRVLSRPYQVDGLVFHLTASVGVAFEDRDGIDEDQLLWRADTALYQAKARGRNRVEVFDAGLAADNASLHRNRQTVRTALNEDRLVMHFQPVVDADIGEVIGFEALARVPDAGGRLHSPGPLIDAVAGTGTVTEFDHQAFRLTCEALARLGEIHPRPLVLGCNFTAATLSQPDLVANLMQTVRCQGVDPRNLVVEVTESVAFDAAESAIANLRQLRARGFMVALDDFGTGYSSLSHLRDLPLSFVKMDRSFAANLGADSSERLITEAVVRLADGLGLYVVAEGVENADQLAAARAVGLRVIQGWYYGRPMALDEVAEAVGPGGRWARGVASTESGAG